MRTWDAFYPLVLPEVLGCPEPTVDAHLRRAARNLFASSLAWRKDVDPITTNGRTEYDMPLPDGADVVRLMSATLDGRDIAISAMDGNTAGERQRADSGHARVLLMDRRTVTLLPKPGIGRRLVLTLCLQPAIDAAGVPDEYAGDYFEAIADGALSTLLTMNKVAWANPQLAGVKAGEFASAVADAKLSTWRAHSNARPRGRAQMF